MAFAPFTPIEFFDASFRDGSPHPLWCVRVVGNVRYEKHPDLPTVVVPPPEDDAADLDLN